jgi:CubicO group peptidase (beta-lactamase class C family)
MRVNHTSGLPMFLPLDMNGVFEKLNESVPEVYLELEKSYDKEKFLEDLKAISIKRELGTNYSYSNAGAELIGYILETVYQKSIDELLKENFSRKHEIINTRIKLDSTQNNKLTRGYLIDNEVQSPKQFNSLWGTAGGMKMTIMNMLRYAKLQLNSKYSMISESHKAL